MIIKYNKYSFKKIFESFTQDEFKIIQDEEKTYLQQNKQNVRRFNYNEYDIFPIIRNYDVFNKFKLIVNNYGGVEIFPDEGFKDLLKQLPEYFNFDIDNLKFYITITNLKNLYLNSIDIGDTIPERLQEFRLATKFYYMIIDKIKLVTTNKFANPIIYNIWINLILNENLYTFTSTFMSGVIHKYVNNNELKNILDDLKYYYIKYNLVFDNELLEKIKEIYGDVESY